MWLSVSHLKESLTMTHSKLLHQNVCSGAGGNLRFIRDFFTLAILCAMILLAQVSPLQAQTLHCDISVFDDEGEFMHFECRAVPEYMIDNVKAVLSRIEEKGRQGPAVTVNGRRPKESFESRLEGLLRHGYRCPDAMGHCPVKWIPDARDYKFDEKGLEYYDADSARTRSGGAFSRSFNFNEDYPWEYPNIKRVSGAGIGVQSILDQNPIDAVNVWGEEAQDGGWVCFQGAGRLIYLDARTSPNAQSALEAVDDPNLPGIQSCGLMTGPGTVVFLAPEGSSGPGSSGPGSDESSTVQTDNERVWIDCETGLPWHFSRISGAGIGDQSILDQNPIDAVDVWGEGSSGGGEACFKGDGRLLYVDTTTIPRTKTYLSTY